jgi:hypothetical protein
MMENWVNEGVLIGASLIGRRVSLREGEPGVVVGGFEYQHPELRLFDVAGLPIEGTDFFTYMRVER